MPEDVFQNDVEVQADIPESAVVNEYRSKITIGDVETLDYGEDAYVTNTGTAEDPILNFGLPKGASGTIWGQLDGTLSDQEDLQAALDAKDTAIALKADIASPALTGTPTAPTATSSTNNTQIATTAFVQNAISILNSSLQSYVQSYVTSAVGNVLKRMNFSNAVSATVSTGSTGNKYTCPSNGYVFLWGKASTNGTYAVSVRGKSVGYLNFTTSDKAPEMFFPVSKNDTISSTVSHANGTIYITFVPMV